MAYPIDKIEGIGPASSEKLSAAGIKTTADLLEECGSAKGRKHMAERTGLSEKQLLKWANMADLMRITGIGEEYAELLEAAGVDTVRELQHRNAESLLAKMTEVNEAKKLTRRVPTVGQVGAWIDQAKTLAPAISH
jgi:predicted flap endonuclease-1-like 5' DNA nuclease